MMTVRFPTGVCVRYNTAYYLLYKSNAWELYTKNPKEGGEWVASISSESGCIVEVIPACAVENPILKLTGENALEYVEANIEGLTATYKGSRLAKSLKGKLSNYTRGNWKAVKA